MCTELNINSSTYSCPPLSNDEREEQKPILALLEKGFPRLTFQSAKILWLHPGANTLNQREMRLSLAGKKELTHGLPLSGP
jgi:hypothetical protein